MSFSLEICQNLQILRSVRVAHWARVVASVLGACLQACLLAGIHPAGKVR